jgi:trans-2-enoyl-CoA reductase
MEMVGTIMRDNGVHCSVVEGMDRLAREETYELSKNSQKVE